MLLLALFLLPSMISGTSEPWNPSTAKPTRSFERNSNPSISTRTQNNNDVFQIIETEVYDTATSSWHGSSFGRWTSVDGGTPMPAPTQTKPPPGYRWEDDWKIVTSSQRDSLGWEYKWYPEPQPAVRQRVWLRSLVLIQDPPYENQPTNRTQSKSTNQFTTKPYKALPSLIPRLLRDDWNWKGWGCAVYKSLIWRESFGAAFQIPLTQNFDWWERHPALPKMSASFAAFYPWMIGCFVSMSLSVDFLAWVIGRALKYLLFSIMWCALWIVRSLSFPLVFAAYPIRRTLSSPVQFPLPPLPNTPLIYSLTTQQQVGITWSWRLSQIRGYEYRFSFWHVYLPTIVYLLQQMGQEGRLPKGLANWLRRKTGAFGLAVGTPLPDPPHWSCSLMLSFNGLYLRQQQRKTRSSTSTTQPNGRIRSQQSDEIPGRTEKTTATTKEEERTRKASEGTEEEMNAAGRKIPRTS